MRDPTKPNKRAMHGTVELWAKTLVRKDEHIATLEARVKQLEAIKEIAKNIDYANQMVIATANRPTTLTEKDSYDWRLECNKWMERLNETLNPDKESGQRG